MQTISAQSKNETFFWRKMGAFMSEGACVLITWRQTFSLPFLEPGFTWTPCYWKLNCFYMVSMEALPRLASPTTHTRVCTHTHTHTPPQPPARCRLGRVRAAQHQPSVRDTEQRTTKVFLLKKHPAIRNVINLCSVLTLVPNLKFIFYLLVLSLGILACRGTP